MTPNVNIPPQVQINGDRFVPFIEVDHLQRRISELAETINRDLEGQLPIFICVLNGAFMFFADLVRQITIDCEVDFLKLSSYGEKKISSGNVQLVKDLNCEVEGRNIVLIEDIVDTGYSIDFMKSWIGKKNPASLKIVTLLHKPASTKIEHPLDYVGFEIPPQFVVGFGLDYAQRARNLPAIYILDNNGSKE
ncbi:MAG: hypoxanthine phosphoribosyltransferase [Ignavibacteria bacterium]|nr:MAG: hypoxanthine phosphoribosyltransferase [Ignavibacteria bacterium]